MVEIIVLIFSTIVFAMDSLDNVEGWVLAILILLLWISFNIREIKSEIKVDNQEKE